MSALCHLLTHTSQQTTGTSCNHLPVSAHCVRGLIPRDPASTEPRPQQSRFCKGAFSESTEVTMHSKLLAIASAAVLMMAGTAAWGQSSTAEKTPGHIMQRTPQAKSTGPGASEYAPGHLKRKSKSQSAPQFTPSHRTTPTTTGMRTR
jgi:hypothetical protein